MWRLWTYENNEYEEVEESHAITSCSACGFQLQDQIQSDEMIEKEINEFDPGQDDVKLWMHYRVGKIYVLLVCKWWDPEFKDEKFIVSRLVETTTEPKTRIKMGSLWWIVC